MGIVLSCSSRTRRSTKLSHSPKTTECARRTRLLLRVFCGRWQGVRNPVREPSTSKRFGACEVTHPVGRAVLCTPIRSFTFLHAHVASLRSAVVDQPNPAASASSHLGEVLELLRKLMEYRSSEVRHRLEKVGRVASMLHMDVLLLIYHFSRASEGNILEIGPYVGGSTIAAAFGARDSRTGKTIVSIEAGGRLKHFRLSSRNIINDLRKNLARFGVAGDVGLINGRSFDEATISEVRQRLSNGDVDLFVFDADNNVRRDLDSYGELLNDGCWVVIDDYFGPAKAAPLRAQVDALVCEGRLVPFGYYGWGTWVGQWHRK